MKMVQSESSKWGDVYKTYVHSKCAKYQYDTTIGYNDSFYAQNAKTDIKLPIRNKPVYQIVPKDA